MAYYGLGDEPKIRRGNIRRALRKVANQVARRKIGFIEYEKQIHASTVERAQHPGELLAGTYNRYPLPRPNKPVDRFPRVTLATHDQYGNPRQPEDILETAAHELAHASGKKWSPDHTSSHARRQAQLEMPMQAMALYYASQDKAFRRKVKQAGRKSSSTGDVSVSAYERDGHPVSAYTRSKPK